MAAASDKDPGVIKGRFRCIRKLGSGAFGAVWLAVDQASNDVPVAIKLLHAKYCDEGEILRRFRREAEILSRLDHPAIARPIAWDVDCDTPFLAMEYVQGSRLDQVIATHVERGTNATLDSVLRIADELCGAVHHANKRQVVHRDLKPRNIIVLAREGRLYIKVLDFGIAKILGADGPDKTMGGRMMGSLLYMAPEQVQAASEVDHRADIFALGTILFELITLRNPWARDSEGRPIASRQVSTTPSELNSDFNAMTRIVKEARPLASASRKDVPSPIDQVLIKALSIDPIARHAGADVLFDDFRRAIFSWMSGAAPSSAPESVEVDVSVENDAGARVSDSRNRKADSRGPKVDSRGPKVDSRGPKTDSRAPQADSRGPKTDKTDSRAPQTDSRDKPVRRLTDSRGNTAPSADSDAPPARLLNEGAGVWSGKRKMMIIAAALVAIAAAAGAAWHFSRRNVVIVASDDAEHVEAVLEPGDKEPSDKEAVNTEAVNTEAVDAAATEQADAHVEETPTPPNEELVKTIEPAEATDTATTIKHRPPQKKSASPAKSPLRKMFETLKARPEDAALREELAAKLNEAADALADPKTTASIKRRVSAGLRFGALEQLEEALSVLERAQN